MIGSPVLHWSKLNGGKGETRQRVLTTAWVYALVPWVEAVRCRTEGACRQAGRPVGYPRVRVGVDDLRTEPVDLGTGRRGHAQLCLQIGHASTQALDLGGGIHHDSEGG